jgi:hypothetical protein
VEDPLCPICGREPETVLHILWTCTLAMGAWSVGSRRLQKKCSMGFENFFPLVEDVSVHCNQEEIKLFVGIARRLWLRRNDLVHEGSLSHPISLVQRTVTAMEEFSKAHKGGEATSVLTAMKTPTIWTAPSSG